MTDVSGRALVIAGATGVVGRHLLSVAHAAGWQLRALTRGEPRRGKGPPVEWVRWRPDAARAGDEAALGAVRAALEGADLVVNLAGASIADGRMNAKLKDRILQSRVDATATLVAALRRCDNPPPVWFQASATGYYGNTGEAVVTESDRASDDFFLADVCRAWEGEAKQLLKDPGPDAVRLVIGRIGLVLAHDAPAWKKLIGPVKWGLGGNLGSGKQWWAWIDADDLARAVLFSADAGGAKGPFNLTSPDPVRQADLTRRAAQRLGRPAVLPAPKLLLRMVLGEAADALLLPSCKALPTRLEEAGFSFDAASLEAALDRLLPPRQ